MQQSSYQPTEADVLAARTALAKARLEWFVRMVDIPGAPLSDAEDEDRFHTIGVNDLAAHHLLLIETLQDIADGTCKRAMFFLPPGSAKSTYGSVVFPAWLMGIKPRHQVIMASYGSDLAKKQGRRTRQLIRSRGYRTLFPEAELSPQSSAADEFQLMTGSEYMAGGILSGLTGNRADTIIIDDPVKGREEADSDTIRAKTTAAYEDDLLTRLKPGGSVLIIQTRWHEDDLSGSILPKDWNGESGNIVCRDGLTWRVICIPAQADRADDPLGREIGEYIWPEWFGPDHWAQFQKNHRTWSALFQQKPSPEEGTFFQRDWFNRHETPPEPVHRYGFSDYAVTEDGGDYTEHGVFGVGASGRIYQLDWWHGQTSSDKWIDSKLDLIKRHRPICWFGEAGVIQKAVEPMLKRAMRERRILCRMEWLPSIHDKPTRSRGFQARAAMGEVSLLEDERGERVLSQLLKFPAGKNDDAVDVCGMIGRALDSAHPAMVPVKEEGGGKPDDYRSVNSSSGSSAWL